MLHNGLKRSLWTSETFWQLPDTTQVFFKDRTLYGKNQRIIIFILQQNAILNGFSFKKKSDSIVIKSNKENILILKT